MKHLLLLTKAFVMALTMCATTYAQTIKNDSITVAIAPQYNRVSKLHRVLLGENYRRLWAVPVKLRVLHIQKEKGGLLIERKGGGMQTSSLRLKDTSGQEWVLRSVQKDAARVLSPKLRKSVARDILQDQVSTANPFAALTVPPLAEALNIEHTHPEIVYLADDEALGEYRKDYANKVYLFEERQPEDATKTDNTFKVQKKIKEDNDVTFDAKIVLRARLLDMLLGDWDRHEDQWRWEKHKNGKQTVYTPIPRDRDQVYYQTSGILPWIVAHQWLKSKFQPYQQNIRDVKAWNINAQYFDRYFLNGLDEADWHEQISYIQQHLTNEVIEAAFKRLPPKIYALSAHQLINTMKARRDHMPDWGMTYYYFLAKIVDIPASDKREKFDINYLIDSMIDVTVHKIAKSDKEKQLVYHRTFIAKQTKEVRLYGFDGDDDFNVTGSGKSPIKIRLIGGSGVDTFNFADNVKHRLSVYDRSDQENIISGKSKATLRLSADTAVNTYNRENYKFDRSEPIILANYNNDYGLSLIAGFAVTKHGFRKEPYASRNEFLVNYSLARHSFELTYQGIFKKAVGNNNLNINVHSLGPNRVNNFFGIGNETVFEQNHTTDEKGDLQKPVEYYRNRYDLVNANISLSHNFNKLVVYAGLAGQYYTSNVANNNQKFLQVYDQSHPDQSVFSSSAYAGFITGFTYDTRNSVIPTKGIYWTTNVTGLQQLNNAHKQYAQLSTEFSFFLNPGGDSTLIIAGRTGWGTTIGNAEYFQQLKLGGLQTLRGYHTWRFTGKSMAYNGLEFRLKVFNFNSYLFPGSIGITGFNDVGRVWVPGEASSNWHDGYGGGIFINPADLISIQYSQGFSTEGSIHYLSFNYRF
ncbi:hypothetical protein [Mucilaginibacter sp. 44-25]|uniref:hypothetical protein n=1 Tax=Mucilaginibacter sp. 44-25 TaxID=1895794 RepID=UPI000965BD34|nr:hypothetical protein [Mucilaginibacter sp. 44-25]OJW15900.1 MAG: hypothetical protein BGO48_04310 [Mucilaginibacter sp. 44-25]